MIEWHGSVDEAVQRYCIARGEWSCDDCPIRAEAGDAPCAQWVAQHKERVCELLEIREGEK